MSWLAAAALLVGSTVIAIELGRRRLNAVSRPQRPPQLDPRGDPDTEH